jgi:hypothetical protein
MPKTKVLIKKSEVSEEEKIIEPDLVVPPMLDEDTPEETEEEESGLDVDEVDPFGDKFEE